MALNFPPKQKLLNILVVVISFLLVAGFFAFAWTEPTSPPPNGNVAAPINVGGTSQYKTGKLGVNTSGIDPNYGFTVGSGGIKVTGSSYFEGDIAATGQVCDVNGCIGAGLWTDAGTYIYPNNYNQFVITDAGRVGIGKTNPSQKLEISGGNIQLPNNYGIYFEGSSQGSNATRIYTTSSSDRLFIRAEDTDNVAQFASYGLYLPQDPGISLYVGGDISLGYSSTSDNDTLYFDRQNEYLRWEDSNGRFVFSADVRASDFCTTGGTCLSSAGGGVSGSGSTNYLPKWTGSTSLGNSQIYDNGSGVGIGTTSPSYKLQVQGDIYANGGWIRVSGSRGIYFQSYGGGWYMQDSTYIRNYGSKQVYLDNYLYAPRIYDQNNTSYYVDPASSSYLNTIYASAFYYSSDRALKDNIQPLNNSLEKIMNLQGVAFEWKDSREKSIGLIAQDVEKVFPELVSTNPSTGLKAIDYNGLIAPLIESIKTQQQMIENQQQEIDKLKAEIEELKNQLNK